MGFEALETLVQDLDETAAWDVLSIQEACSTIACRDSCNGHQLFTNVEVGSHMNSVRSVALVIHKRWANDVYMIGTTQDSTVVGIRTVLIAGCHLPSSGQSLQEYRRSVERLAELLTDHRKQNMAGRSGVPGIEANENGCGIVPNPIPTAP